MTSNRMMAAALLLALSGGAALAQDGMDQPRTGFYADPVLPDPSPVAAHVFTAPEATADVAAVTPARQQTRIACGARNPCAVSTPAARG
jgi:hypothetical protein